MSDLPEPEMQVAEVVLRLGRVRRVLSPAGFDDLAGRLMVLIGEYALEAAQERAHRRVRPADGAIISFPDGGRRSDAHRPVATGDGAQHPETSQD